MPADHLSLGIFTTDVNLMVRTWDAWMAAAMLPGGGFLGSTLNSAAMLVACSAVIDAGCGSGAGADPCTASA